MRILATFIIFSTALAGFNSSAFELWEGQGIWRCKNSRPIFVRLGDGTIREHKSGKNQLPNRDANTHVEYEVENLNNGKRFIQFYLRNTNEKIATMEDVGTYWSLKWSRWNFAGPNKMKTYRCYIY